MNIPNQFSLNHPEYRALVNMDVIDNYVVWLPPRTGSVLFSEIFSGTDFRCYNYKNGNFELIKNNLVHNHLFTLFKNIESYKLIMTTRNPYTWAVAHFYMFNSLKNPEKIHDEFQYFLESRIYQHPAITELLYNLNYVEISYPIRIENLLQDYLELPIISKSKYFKEKNLDKIINSKVNKSSSPLAKLDYRLFYNKNSSDIIYHLFSKYFDTFGYDKNSWK